MVKVMIVDDSPFVYEIMNDFLAGSEFSVVGYARSGEEALELYEEIRPDIVTMDIILPGIDGLEAAEDILTKWPDAKILIVSSLAYDDTIEKSQEIGAKSFIYKPIEKEHLLEALNRCIEPQKPEPEAAQQTEEP